MLGAAIMVLMGADKERQRRLHGHNASLGGGGKKQMVVTPVPSFLRSLEPREEEVTSLEKATGHFKAQLGGPSQHPMVREASIRYGMNCHSVSTTGNRSVAITLYQRRWRS